jgi:hypothetical protein
MKKNKGSKQPKTIISRRNKIKKQPFWDYFAKKLKELGDI